VSDLLDLCTVNATWNRGPCAEVRVGEHVTRYVRRGTGPSVVLLGADAEANPIWSPLVESLSTSHRLVVPQMPLECVDSSEWLRGFIEGIGLTSVVMIAGGALADAALELATTDDFTIRKLVLVPNEGAAVAHASDRLLWVSPDWPTADSVRRIEEFVASNGNRAD
jgi:hypothetical protein